MLAADGVDAGVSVADRVQAFTAAAAARLEERSEGELPEIQSTTGPGNLTGTIFELAQEHAETAIALLVLPDWEGVATSRWPLGYRRDARNWRLSNRRVYEPPEWG